MKTFNEFRKEIEIQHANIHLDEGLGVVLAATTAAAGYGAYKIGRAALLVISAIATQLNDIIAAKWRRANGVSKAASQKCKYASGFDGGSKQYKKCILSAYIDGAKDKIDILMQMKSEVSNKFDDEKANLYHKTIEAEIVKLKNKIGKWEGQIEFIDSHLQKWESVKIEGDILESKDPESYQKVTLPIHPLDLIDFDKHVTSVSKKHKISIENLLSRIGNLISTYKKDQ